MVVLVKINYLYIFSQTKVQLASWVTLMFLNKDI